MYLYQLLLLNALWIFGFNALFHDGHILWFAQKYAATRIGGYKSTMYTVLRPFAFCVCCMSSVHGFTFYTIASVLKYHTFNIFAAPLYCIVLLGCINLISNILTFLNR